MTSDLSIAVSWWQISAGGSRQAVRGNVRALQAAGHDVDLYFGNELRQLEASASAYDAVVLPYIHYAGDWSAYEDTHVHLQLGGFPAEAQPAQSKQAIETADTVSALDPSIISYFQQYWQLDPIDIALVPNPPNRDLFPRHDRDMAQDHAFVPKLGSAQKDAQELGGIATASPDTEYHVLYTGEGVPPSLSPNVQYWPSVPLTQMPTQYRDARVICNPSHKDVLPNTAFEAWLSGRPYVCRDGAIGHIQSVPADVLDTMWWGRSVTDWYSAYADYLGTGDHYIGRGDEIDTDGAAEAADTALGESVQGLMTDAEFWRETVAAADAWLDTWGDWDWESKGHVLTAVLENAGPLAG